MPIPVAFTDPKTNILCGLCLLLLLPAQMLLAQTTWTGDVDNSWAVAGNWTAGVPDAADDVTIPNTTVKPTILGGTAAVAQSVMVEADAELTINATASLTIENAPTQGLGNAGTVTNNGTISIGATHSGGTYGLVNGGTFYNGSGGIIGIDSTDNMGLWNHMGTFENRGRIDIGTLASISGPGVYNEATFENIGGTINIAPRRTGIYNLANSSFINSGSITVGRLGNFTGPGIYNFSTFENNGAGEITIDNCRAGIDNRPDGIFTNRAKIAIGETGPLGSIGFYNEGSFTNANTGVLNIDWCRTAMHLHSGSSFGNFGKISIGINREIQDNGIDNYASFNNFANAEIRIDSVERSGITHFADTFTNSGKITIGITADYNDGPPLFNESVFENTGTGVINLDRMFGYEATLQNNTSTGIFTNSGLLTIGAQESGGAIGIYNAGTFSNTTGAIHIDRISTDQYTSNGIYNSTSNNAFTNTGIITIGNTISAGRHGIYNDRGDFNNDGGEISIENIVNDGNNHGLRHNSDTFTNTGKITIGGTAGSTKWGLWNQSVFKNDAGGEIFIDRSTITALQNNHQSFTNSGKLTIGSKTAIGDWGIYSRTNFDNTGGEIHIDNAAISALRNQLDTFTNSGKIVLGNTATVGDWGLWNEDVFQNEATGEISINRSPNTGLHNSLGTFNNVGKISIGPDISLLSLANYLNFNNLECSQIDITAGAVNNQSTVVNDGFMSVSTNLPHTNAGTFTNNGILEYPQGNPIPDVIDNNTDPLAIVFTAQYCPNDPGPVIGMSSSEAGAMYQLQDGSGNNLGAAVTGTGAAISFGAYPNGDYRVAITNGTCDLVLNATVDATATNCGIEVPNFCSCNAPSGYAPVTIKISAPEGQNWTVKEVSGLYTSAMPLPQVAIGDPLSYIGGDMYTLEVFRSNTNGYFVKVTNGTTDLDIQVGNP